MGLGRKKGFPRRDIIIVRFDVEGKLGLDEVLGTKRIT
jgi:hypothetical protein